MVVSDFPLRLNFACLQNDRLKLVPLESDLPTYATAFVTDALTHPSIYDYLTYGPFATPAEYIAWFDAHIRNDPSVTLLAVLALPGAITRKDPQTGRSATLEIPSETFAGIAGLIAQPEHATVDLGLMLVSTFQRTFVATHAVGLLLHHCLDRPEQRGLGVRRVQWQANAENEASVSAAERLGFRKEAVVRWAQVLPEGKTGSAEKGMPVEGAGRIWLGKGRHTAVLAVCWDDWISGGREHVRRLMER